MTGVQSERSAWLSEAEVKTGSGSFRRQLFAGSGYHASNERVLHFGLGEADIAESITVHWPSGQQSVMTAVPADCTIEIREGFPTAIRRFGSELSVIPVQCDTASVPAELNGPR